MYLYFCCFSCFRARKLKFITQVLTEVIVVHVTHAELECNLKYLTITGVLATRICNVCVLSHAVVVGVSTPTSSA